MNTVICVCCGEPIPGTGNKLSRHPNVCASCSSMADGLEDVHHLPDREVPLPQSPAKRAGLDDGSHHRLTHSRRAA